MPLAACTSSAHAHLASALLLQHPLLLQQGVDARLHLSVRHQLLLAELGKVDHSAEVAPQACAVGLVHILRACTAVCECLQVMWDGIR